MPCRKFSRARWQITETVNVIIFVVAKTSNLLCFLANWKTADISKFVCEFHICKLQFILITWMILLFRNGMFFRILPSTKNGNFFTFTLKCLFYMIYLTLFFSMLFQLFFSTVYNFFINNIKIHTFIRFNWKNCSQCVYFYESYKQFDWLWGYTVYCSRSVIV